MLSPNDLSLLYKTISDKNQTFENISKVFQLNFNKDIQIKVSHTLFKEKNFLIDFLLE